MGGGIKAETNVVCVLTPQHNYTDLKHHFTKLEHLMNILPQH